jgi:hypothetical protein
MHITTKDDLRSCKHRSSSVSFQANLFFKKESRMKRKQCAAIAAGLPSLAAAYHFTQKVWKVTV